MQIIITENISLAYNLGLASAGPIENERLYGILPGHQVRGQNLKVQLYWLGSGVADEPRQVKEDTKKLLQVWDHSFLNQQSEFLNGQAVTLERICQSIWQKFVGLYPDAAIGIEVEQGVWTALANKFWPKNEMGLQYKTRFQSLLKNSQGFLPIDTLLTVTWQGPVDSKTGVIYPWPALKQQLVLEDGGAPENMELDGFLQVVAKRISQSAKTSKTMDDFSPAKILKISFYDEKDKWLVEFNSPKDFS